MLARTSLIALTALVLTGCGLFRAAGLAPNEADPTAIVKAAGTDEPGHVVLQHVLLSFDGAGLPGVTRTRDEAERLAQRVLDQARNGHDFAELVRLYSDDTPGEGKGTYAVANWGVPPGTDEVERRKLVRGFGNLGFALGVGEIGLVSYDENASPFGWHVLKRLR